MLSSWQRIWYNKLKSKAASKEGWVFMPQEDKRKIKIGIAVAAFAIVFYLSIQNFSKVLDLIGFVMNLFSAFIIGLCVAFVLNLFMTFFEKRVLSHINGRKHPRFARMKRPIAIIVTVIVVLTIIGGLFAFIIPQLADSVKTLIANVPEYIKSLENFANETLSKFGISADLNETLTSYLTEITDAVLNFLSYSLPKIFQGTINFTSGVVNAFLGFIVGLYMLSGKEILLANSKKVLYAFVPRSGADYFMHVYRIAKQRFSGFVTGQLTEAVIIGVLCFLGMKLFRMEYALLISVIIGVTNMIPIIGPIVGAVPGALIMLMVKPIQALWFVLFIILLQQLESNLIYPKVVGDSIGLPGIWVLFAITIGGSLFGLPGVLLGVPTFAVIYTLISEIVQARLKAKKIRLRNKGGGSV